MALEQLASSPLYEAWDTSVDFFDCVRTTLNRRLYITTDFSTISSNKIGIEFTFVNNKTQIICGVCSYLHDFLAVIVLENVGEFVVIVIYINAVVLSLGRSVVRSFCRSVILKFCQIVVLSLC